MKLSLEEKSRLMELGGKASDLLVNIMDENLPKTKEPTKNDTEFKEILSQIHEICPLLSDSYTGMYNYIQKQKTASKDYYVKRIKKF